MGLASAIEAGSAFVKLIAQDTMSPVFDRAGKSFESLGGTLTTTGGLVAAAGASIVTPLVAAAVQFAAAGSALDDMANRTGIAGSQLAAIGFAAQQSGTSLEKFEGAIVKQTKFLAAASEGGDKAKEALDGIGLSFAEIEGLKPDEQFAAIGQALSEIPDQTTRSAKAMEIWGKSANDLLPIFADGVDGLNKLTAQAEKLGLVMGPEEIANAAKLGDAIDILTNQGAALANKIGAALAPTLLNLLEISQPIIANVIEWVGANGELITTVASVGAGLLAAGGAIVGVGTAFSVLGVAFGGLATAASVVGTVVGAVGAALAFVVASPVGLAAVGIAGLAAAFTDWNSVLTTSGEGIMALWGTAREVFGGIGDLIMAGDWQGAMDLAVTALQVAWETGLATVTGLWIDFKETYLGHIPEFWTAMQEAWDFIRGLWDAGVGFLQQAWTATVSFIGDQWQKVSQFIGDTFGSATSLFGEDNQTMADYVYDFAKIVTNVWASLETSWVETVTFLSNVWTSFTSSVTGLWSRISGAIAGGLVRIAGAVGIVNDVTGTLAVLTEDQERAQKSRDASTNKTMDDRLAERDKRLKAIEGNRAAMVADLDNRKLTNRAAGKNGFTVQREENNAALQASKDRLQEALDRTKRIREGKETPEDKKAEPGKPKLEDIKQLGGMATFNAAAARGIGVSSAADRTAKATEKCAGLLEQINKKEGGVDVE